MIEDFNIRDNDWDSYYIYYSVYNDIFIEVADFFNLKLFSSINQVPTQYTNNPNDFNSVIDPIFLQSNLMEINNHFILLNL